MSGLSTGSTWRISAATPPSDPRSRCLRNPPTVLAAERPEKRPDLTTRTDRGTERPRTPEGLQARRPQTGQLRQPVWDHSARAMASCTCAGAAAGSTPW